MASTAPPTPGNRVLFTYSGPGGTPRELIVRDGAAGSLLVIDRGRAGGHDELLLAHLAADEPLENATAVCRQYLASEPPRRRCRPVLRSDEDAPPFEPRPRAAAADAALTDAVLRRGLEYRLQPMRTRMRIPELRWTRRRELSCDEPHTVSLRDVVGASESYEPFCSMTRQALACHRGDPAVSTVALRNEIERVEASAIVLNRALREAVLRAVAGGSVSLSEIATRCGRVKRDRRGNFSGETSWLARRIGLLAEGGQGGTTPWVHSDVLGLIARHGLNISPREVELG